MRSRNGNLTICISMTTQQTPSADDMIWLEAPTAALMSLVIHVSLCLNYILYSYPSEMMKCEKRKNKNINTWKPYFNTFSRTRRKHICCHVFSVKQSLSLVNPGEPRAERSVTNCQREHTHTIRWKGRPTFWAYRSNRSSQWLCEGNIPRQTSRKSSSPQSSCISW